jgi:hypothetical protein
MLILAFAYCLSLGFTFLQIPSGFPSRILHGNPFPDTLFTCPNHLNRFSSVISHIFFPTPIYAISVSFDYFLSLFPSGSSPKIHHNNNENTRQLEAPLSSSYLYILMQKAVTLNTCCIVRKFLEEECIRSAWSVRS